MITLNHYLILSAILFAIGTMGALTRRNAIIVVICIEIMLSAVSLTIMAFAKYLHNMDGHIFILMVIVVAAAEAAVGLAIIISMFRLKEHINIDDFNELKG